MKLLENGPQFASSYTDPGIPYLDAQHVTAAPATEQYPTCGGVFQRVAQQVADHLFKQAGVTIDHGLVGQDAQAQSFGFSHIAELVANMRHHLADREQTGLGLDDARLDLVDIEKRVQHSGHGPQCLVKAMNQLATFIAFYRLCQHCLEQGQRLQRLAQIMAGGRKKP